MLAIVPVKVIVASAVPSPVVNVRPAMPDSVMVPFVPVSVTCTLPRRHPRRRSAISANAAHWRDGVLVHVPRAAAVEQPVVTPSMPPPPPPTVRSIPRVLVVAEERSEVTIVLR